MDFFSSLWLVECELSVFAPAAAEWLGSFAKVEKVKNADSKNINKDDF
jgi:hypothetical protein